MKQQTMTMNELYQVVSDLPDYVELDMGFGYFEMEYLSNYSQVGGLHTIEDGFDVVISDTSEIRRVPGSKVVHIRYEQDHSYEGDIVSIDEGLIVDVQVLAGRSPMKGSGVLQDFTCPNCAGNMGVAMFYPDEVDYHMCLKCFKAIRLVYVLENETI